MIGTCLARLKAEVDTREEVPLEETLWKSHITLNEKNTPWFFHLANLPLPKRSPPHNSSSSGDRRPKLNPKSLSDPCFPSSPDTAPEQILHRTLTLDEQQIDDFTWLQVRDPGHGDILAIRIGREGKVDKPLVLLDSAINNNTAQYSDKVLSHAGVDVVLIKEGERLSYLLQKNFSSNHQFCAILPLEPKAYEGQRQNGSRASIFEPLEELLDLESFYRIYDLECSSHANRKRPQVEDRSNEESDEEHNAENHRGSCDEDTSDEEADTGSEYDSIGDFSEEEAEEGEEEEVDEEDVDDEDADADTDDDDAGDDANDDNNDDDDDDNELTTNKDELNIPEKLNQRLENLHEAWNRHKWPNEKRQIITFARVAFRVQFAHQKAYNVKNGDFYRQVGEGPTDWMTPVEGFGKSFLRVIRIEKRSSLNNKSADDQSHEDFDTGKTLGGSRDKGKKAVKGLGSKFKSLGIK